MTGFQNKPKLKFICKNDNGNKIYKLKEEIIYKNLEIKVVIARNFETDGATIPYPLNKIMKADDKRYLSCAILHDFLYHVKYDRKRSDYLFLESMKSELVPLHIRTVFFLAVRLFGHKYY